MLYKLVSFQICFPRKHSCHDLYLSIRRNIILQNNNDNYFMETFILYSAIETIHKQSTLEYTSKLLVLCIRTKKEESYDERWEPKLSYDFTGFQMMKTKLYILLCTMETSLEKVVTIG